MTQRRRLDLPAPWVCVALALATPVRAGEEKLVAPGLQRPVEIFRDRWGIAHIYAQNEHDLFFAQGFNVAGDRLFQLELWRRQASGTMAEIQGPKALQHDVGARLLKFKGDMARELNHYHPRGAAIVSAFVEGINAYIELTRREPKRLPLEFHILAIKPAPWTPEIVVSRHNGLFRNVTQELQHAQLVHLLGRDRAKGLLNLHPGSPTLDTDEAINLGFLRDAVLETYKTSRSPIKFQPEDVRPSYRREAGEPERKSAGPARNAGSEARIASLADDDDRATEGSNNWVISGDRMLSRAPIMANDPHRVVQIPSLRYWVHLVAPGWNVIGAGEPALPGVSVGHNEHGAWGFTIFPVDQEDLYVYETNPSDPSQYRWRGAWEPMRVVQEPIPVKGQEATVAKLKFTRHGPIVYEDTAHSVAYALRAAWLEEGSAPYLASLRIDQATSWESFREACRYFLTPSENIVWADVAGHIGWQAVGLVPVRKNWNGLLPVPGDGRYEWGGFLPILELPYILDPEKGWFASANQENLPKGYPFTVGFQWTDPFRFGRLEEVLGSGRRFTLMDLMQLQQDELSLPARSLMPLLCGLKSVDGKQKEALTLLASWNFVLDKDSVPAAIYATWEKALHGGVWEQRVPSEARKVFPRESLSMEKLIQLVTVPDGTFGSNPIAGRDALLVKALDQALEELERRLGPDMRQWRYGQERLKHIRLTHPLSTAVNAELRSRLDLGPLPRGGSSATVNNTSDKENQATGASFRIIADVGDWDRSVGTNAPGQSGDPDSGHYQDLFAPWAEGKYFPTFYARAKVESVTESRTNLVPGMFQQQASPDEPVK